MFRILALEILSPKDGHPLLSHIPDANRDIIELRKQDRCQSVVKVYDDGVDQIIRFYRDIDKKKMERYHKVVSKSSPFVESFYNVGGTKISVNAIVGMNGSGKSTILDIFLRIMNNVAYALSAGIDNNESFELHYAECVFARLYLETHDGYFVKIYQYDHELEISVQVNRHGKEYEPLICKFNNETDKGAKRKGIELTPKQCQKILSRLFYTIVVNHAAYSYNICDYRSEWIDFDEKRIFDYEQLHTKGNEPEAPFEDESELTLRKDDEELCWIGSLFHKNDSYQTPIVLNPYRRRGNIDYNKEKQLLNDRIFLMLTYNREALAEMLDGKEPYSFEFCNIENFLPNTFKDGYFRSRKVYNALNDLKAFSYKEQDPEDRNTIRTVRMPNAQICAKIDSIAKQIIKEWEKCVGVKLHNDLTKDTPKDIIAALNYLAYKTIKSSYYYSEFRDYSDDIANGKNIDELVKDLYCNNTHITLKLRRTLAFLLFYHYGVEHLHDGNKYSNESILSVFNEHLDSILAKQKEAYCSKSKVDGAYTQKDYKEGQKPHGKWIREELLPAPHLQTKLWLKLPGGEMQTFDRLSSGEKQLLYVMSAVVYQLHHLNSAGEGKIQYKSANLIFDEVDLYFHPEYQRKLIDYIIRVIGKLNLNKIKNINIMLATHSPFVLSDIPKNNILYLEKGRDKSDSVKVNPLGANISDVLSQSFFLTDGFMGEYVRKKLNKIVDTLSLKASISDVQFDEMESIISNVGEPLLRETIARMLIEKRYEYTRNEVGALFERMRNKR